MHLILIFAPIFQVKHSEWSSALTSAVEGCFCIFPALYLHGPGVIVAEIEQIPELGVGPRWLNYVSVVDFGVSHLVLDDILESMVVALHRMLAQYVGNGVSNVCLFVRSIEPVQKNDVQSDLRLSQLTFMRQAATAEVASRLIAVPPSIQMWSSITAGMNSEGRKAELTT